MKAGTLIINPNRPAKSVLVSVENGDEYLQVQDNVEGALTAAAIAQAIGVERICVHDDCNAVFKTALHMALKRDGWQRRPAEYTEYAYI